MTAMGTRLAWLAVLSMVLPGCGGSGASPTSQPTGAAREAAPVALRDWVRNPAVAAGEREAKRRRLVCLAPSATEVCCALGLQEQIVARTRFCDYPPEIRLVPAIGALDETNAEVLLGLKPDLILISGTSRAIRGRLERLELPFESLPDRSLADVFVAIERVGELAGRDETARRLCESIEGELSAVARRYADAAPQRVLVLLGPLADPPAPPFVAGPGSFYDDLLRRGGHENVAAAGVRAYGPLSLEAIVRADPDVIIELDADGRGRPGGAAEALGMWARLGGLRAVSAGRVHVLTGQQHFVPGPRIAQAFAELCRAIAGPQDD